MKRLNRTTKLNSIPKDHCAISRGSMVIDGLQTSTDGVTLKSSNDIDYESVFKGVLRNRVCWAC